MRREKGTREVELLTKSYLVMPLEDETGEKKKFEAYPTRGITLANETWLELKTAKLNSGTNWNKFIKELLKKTKRH